MRDYLRRTCGDIWVIDCSPEGHQPAVNSRIFQGVQQPVCIVLASRSSAVKKNVDTPAKVLFQALPIGNREVKFKALSALRLKSSDWVECPSDWRAAFLPAPTGAWATYPKLEDLFIYNGSGVMPGRTWVIAPDAASLQHRWSKLINAPQNQIERLFHPHLNHGKLGDRHSNRIVKEGLPGFEARLTPVANDANPCIEPVRYGFRSFDREWIIPDNRLLNRPNPELWRIRSDHQIYLTAFAEESPSSGPALTFTGYIPDLHHYKGSFGGRAFPLWRDKNALVHNFRPKLLPFLNKAYGTPVMAEDLLAYIAAVAAHPGFTARFQSDLSTPGLHIPLTATLDTFSEAVELGRKVIWLYSFGERIVDAEKGRPAGPPRLPAEKHPQIPTAGAIPDDKDSMPDSIDYDAGKKRLMIGHGYVENVEPKVWLYEVSGKQVLLQWFSYRKKHRERPIIGDRRQPSPLGDIQPDHWLPEYTTELINVLNVLGLIVELEPAQAKLLEKVCSGPLISSEELQAAGAFTVPPMPKKTKQGKKAKATAHMFETEDAPVT